MSESKLRVAVVSGVRHATPYLEILARDERVELVGVGEEPGAPAWMLADGRAAAQRAGITWHGDLGDWLHPDSVDLAIVCSEPTRHARLAIDCLGRGIDVLIDKPVGVTLDDADRVLDAVQKSGRRCSVINRTHAPALRRLRSWVDSGHLGLPRHLDMEFFASGAFFETSVERPELVVDPRLSGGGEMLNFLGYCVDAIRYVSGLEVESVYAMSGQLFSAIHAANGVEDTAIVSLGLQYGVTATITVGRIPFAPGFGPTSSSLRVLGSHAHAVADDDRPALQRFGGDPVVSAESFDGGQEALRAYLDHVVERSLANADSDYTIVDARASVAVIDAAYRSEELGETQRPL